VTWEAGHGGGRAGEYARNSWCWARRDGSKRACAHPGCLVDGSQSERCRSERCLRAVPGHPCFYTRSRTVVRPLPCIKKRSTLGVAVNVRMCLHMNERNCNARRHPQVTGVASPSARPPLLQNWVRTNLFRSDGDGGRPRGRPATSQHGRPPEELRQRTECRCSRRTNQAWAAR
jgi:hypothetical protein